jgi:DNA topoisomerase-2
MVDINKETGELSVWNNGSSIPIVIHKEYNIYVPELIFGHLLTSGNYDQTGKTVGGKNGLGSKVANIYSIKYEIEICDPVRKKKYFQRFRNNMYDKEEPIITSISSSTESYTKITFLPDYKRFGLKNLSDDMVSLLKRRVYDTAGTTNENVSVWLNQIQLNIKSFKDYIGMYYSGDNDPDLIYEEFNERWTLGIVYDPNTGFQHNRQLPDLDLWEILVNDGLLVRAGSHDILDIQVDRHHRGVCEIAKSCLLWKHNLGCARIFVDLWAVQIQIAE